MISTVFAELFGLVDRCVVCRQKPEQEPWRFIKGNVEIVVCDACNFDFFNLHGELLAETVQRSACDPREVLWWGQRH
jgi:hypothetical protein